MWLLVCIRASGKLSEAFNLVGCTCRSFTAHTHARIYTFFLTVLEYPCRFTDAYFHEQLIQNSVSALSSRRIQ